MQLFYSSDSVVQGDVIALAINQAREPVSLQARLRRPLPFRDCMLALRACILSRHYIPTEEIIAAQLDPVITVNPSGVYFEAFSQDESSYARVTLRPEALDGLTDTSYGCTNIAFTDALARGLRELRSASTATLEVGREGVKLRAERGEQRETRIDLPTSWVQGFVEVQAAQAAAGVTLDCVPLELLNVLNYLQKRKANVSPRCLRIQLEPGSAPRIVVEPWGHVVDMRRSTHDSAVAREVRVWGRRRLLLLAGILGHARRVRVTLQGSAAPSFWTVDLAEMSFVLGLSPWSAREWTVAEACTGLTVPLSPPAEMVQRVLALLEERMALSEDELRAEAGVEPGILDAALRTLCYRGRVLFDRESSIYVARKLFDHDPEDPPALSKRQTEARRIVELGRVALQQADGWYEGSVRGKGGTYKVRVATNGDGTLREGACSCPYFARHGASRGACKHLLAAGLSLQGG
jgi:hypothetical protein